MLTPRSLYVKVREEAALQCQECEGPLYCLVGSVLRSFLAETKVRVFYAG